MLFTPENAQKVMSGQKTQTRRPEQEQDEPEYDALGKIWRVVNRPNDIYSRLRWQVGKKYAVQPGRGKNAIGHIRLKSIRRERVNEISEADARAEGVTAGLGKNGYWNPASGNFADLWDSIYSGRMAFNASPMVWVLEFEKGTRAMIELLKRLAATEPEFCHEETSGGAIAYFRFGEAVLGIMEQRLIVHLSPDGQVIGDDVALFWLQGILQQAIERRGWPYVISYNGDDHHARVGNYPAVSVDGYTNAAKAILAAYVEAVEGEEQSTTPG